MPQIGWLDDKGNTFSFEEALALAHEDGEWGGMPYEVLKGIEWQVTRPRPESFSVTQMLGCARKVFLEEQNDFFVRPADNYAAFRGTIIHSILERFASDDDAGEKRIERTHRGVTISGQPDSLRQMVEKNGRHLLRDYKSTAKLPLYDNAYTHHQEQVNIYRWLLGLDWRLTDIEIVYLSMEGVKIIPLKRGGVGRTGRAIPNQMWTDAKVENFLDERLLILNAQREHNTPVAYDKVPDEHLWQCEKYCPVKDRCYRLAGIEQRAAWAKSENVDRIPPREREQKKGKK